MFSINQVPVSGCQYDTPPVKEVYSDIFKILTRLLANYSGKAHLKCVIILLKRRELNLKSEIYLRFTDVGQGSGEQILQPLANFSNFFREK